MTHEEFAKVIKEAYEKRNEAWAKALVHLKFVNEMDQAIANLAEKLLDKLQEPKS